MVTDDVFAVIAESTRRDILTSLRSGDKAVGELVEELAASQPTISKHLKVLREAQLVSMRAQGQKRYYALNRQPLEGIASWLETFDVGSAAAPAKSPAALASVAGSRDEASGTVRRGKRNG
jgi:DNA-binding transcriptional ArsR family regulator